jgi:acetate kinase
MKILALNCGSSSLKFQVLDLQQGDQPCRRMSWGRAKIGATGLISFESAAGHRLHHEHFSVSHADAVTLLLDWLKEEETPNTPALEAVGHRVVHGGNEFTKPTLIDKRLLQSLDKLRGLAPLHNGASLEVIQKCRSLLGEAVPMVATFDTTFHATLPEHARRYAIPEELTIKHQLWRYGFHGLAHRWMMERYAALRKSSIETAKLITLQLGSGCSAAAIRQGCSVETSMGLTPLEGLMMATRSGDVDASLPGLLAKHESVSSEEIENLLNKRSGLLGIHGGSADIREVLEGERHGDRRAALALEMFCHRIRKYVGAYLAVLNGADAIIFGGGIGENTPEIRARVCSNLSWCGVRLDPARNQHAVGKEALISSEDSRIMVYVIPVNEEMLIAWDTQECLRVSVQC